MPGKGENDGFTPEQYLVAAVAEYKNLEPVNRSYMERMAQSLSSPFKISPKSCEQQRMNVLQCYDRVLKTSAHAEGGTAAGDASASSPGSSDSPAPVKAQMQMSSQSLSERPIHHCYPDAVIYQKCVKENTLSQHLALTARFEERRLAALSSKTADA